jgi:predicted negative regulator of RcsB-dependent stress response
MSRSSMIAGLALAGGSLVEALRWLAEPGNAQTLFVALASAAVAAWSVWQGRTVGRWHRDVATREDALRHREQIVAHRERCLDRLEQHLKSRADHSQEDTP